MNWQYPKQSVYVILIICIMCLSFFAAYRRIRHTEFDWINETTCVKQSGSVMLTMFGGMGILVVPVLLYIFVLRFLPLMAYAYLCLLLCVIGCVLAYLYLIRKGVALFENLQS